MHLFQRLVVASLALGVAGTAHADPTVLGTTHASQPIAANTAVTLIAPTANANGAILTTAVLQTTAGGTANLQTLPDGYLIFDILNQSGASAGNLPYAIYLPAGVGLEAAATVQSTVWVTYDLH